MNERKTLLDPALSRTIDKERAVLALSGISDIVAKMQNDITDFFSRNLSVANTDRDVDSVLSNLGRRMENRLPGLEQCITALSDCTGTRQDLWLQFSQATAEYSGQELPMYEITVRDDAVYIRMPYLPSRRSRATSVTDGLAAALSRAAMPTGWQHCHIDFCHVHPSNSRIPAKDNDNYNYKRAIDIISYSLHLHDEPGRVYYTMRSCITDDLPPATYIKITQKSSEIPSFPKAAERP